MKRICIALLTMMVFVLSYCTSARKASKKQPPKITYMANIQPIISTSCAPCHIPPQGNKKPFQTYETAKTDIDEMIARISRNPGEKGFMPMRHPKLSADTIATFVKWKEDGLLEK